jgi:hypothetical protein
MVKSDGAEPHLVDSSMLPEELLEIFPGRFEGNITHKDSAITPLFQLEGRKLGFFFFYIGTIVMGGIV